MDRYSKINIMSLHSKNSRSMDSSDLQSFSPTQKSNITTPTMKTLEANLQMKCNNNNTTQDQKGDEEDDEQGNSSSTVGGERFGSLVVLKRNNSVSSSSSSASSGFRSALKAAFSIRRSSSVSERYCRIYDQSATTALTSPMDDDDDDDDEDESAWGATRSMKKKHRGGKIFKACKRFFGL